MRKPRIINTINWMIMACIVVLSIACAHKRGVTKSVVAAEREVLMKDAFALFGEEKLGAVKAALLEKHNSTYAERVNFGVDQVARMWRAEDGDYDVFKSFCIENFASEEADRKKILMRFENNLEQISGHLLEVDRYLREPTDLDIGPVSPFEKMFAEYDLNAHVIDDFYKTKIGFVILLNFKEYSLTQMLESGDKWSREEWARARAVQLFSARVPSKISQKISSAFARADNYINNYNVYMHNLKDSRGERLFPKGLKLISHWGLRDELKAQYGQDDGLAKQRLIQEVMERIIRQEIPQSVINNPEVIWNVEKNTTENMSGGLVSSEREQDSRYEQILGIFHAEKLADPYYPAMPTYVERKFEDSREIPKNEAIALLESVLRAPIIKDVGRLIEKRNGRKLETFDIWYDGFTPRGDHDQEKLDDFVRAKYSDAKTFQEGIPQILMALGFDKETSVFLGSKIVVDSARGAGHAMGAERREDNAHLRTRVPSEGMNYKGYNIAIHELGHNVEQVFSLNRIDHYLLNGVPNTAFTEGFAFTFQNRDMKILGMQEDDKDNVHLEALDAIWSTYEIAGVAMVDIAIWDWMYENPEATAEELRIAVVDIAKNVWNEYFAPVFGVEDQILLAIYSHIVDAGMYIPDYPLGLLIQFQMEEYFRKNGLATEMERMCRQGAITPDAWMREAVGSPLSAKPLIDAATIALEKLPE